jgi:pimeloyl-ACP methyl ester carboxylesterase
MAKTGFVAVSLDYGTRKAYPSNCGALEDSVMALLDESDPNSAVELVASRLKADPAKGIVVMGFSQGANIASLAANHNPDVRAAYLIGNGCQSWGTACYGKASIALPASGIRSVMGQNDSIYSQGGGPDDNRQVMETTTGYGCGPSALSCLQGNGSGWYLVQASQTADGEDDHCFHYGAGF